jgi:hypothetical protein
MNTFQKACVIIWRIVTPAASSSNPRARHQGARCPPHPSAKTSPEPLGTLQADRGSIFREAPLRPRGQGRLDTCSGHIVATFVLHVEILNGPGYGTAWLLLSLSNVAMSAMLF